MTLTRLTQFSRYLDMTTTTDTFLDFRKTFFFCKYKHNVKNQRGKYDISLTCVCLWFYVSSLIKYHLM